jgi:thiosulfate/3-mercaptopyruvate sulfurtransferase
MDLVSVEWLDHLGDPIRLADCALVTRPAGGRRGYTRGHLPGAIFVDLPTVAGPEGPGRHPLPDPATFAGTVGALGIGSEHLVVAYDDAGGTIAARLWWMLEDLGHERVAVLDGGIAAWVAGGGPLTTEAPAWPPTTLRGTSDRWRRTIEREALIPRLGTLTLLDARAGERYRGEVEPVDPVAGHIPTARSAPTDGSLAADGRLRSPAELRERFEALGAATGEVVTTCGSGVTACHTALAMRVAGLPDPLLFPGSYSDWSRSGMPVATGPDLGDPPAATSATGPRS